MLQIKLLNPYAKYGILKTSLPNSSLLLVQWLTLIPSMIKSPPVNFQRKRTPKTVNYCLLFLPRFGPRPLRLHRYQCLLPTSRCHISLNKASLSLRFHDLTLCRSRALSTRSSGARAHLVAFFRLHYVTLRLFGLKFQNFSRERI